MEGEKSILNSVKKLLGYPPEMTAFDADITVNVNAALASLTQMGVGPKSGFLISGPETTYDEFVENEEQHGMIAMFLYIKTKLGFDPPASATITQSLTELLKEYEWRLMAAYNPPDTFE